MEQKNKKKHKNVLQRILNACQTSSHLYGSCIAGSNNGNEQPCHHSHASIPTVTVAPHTTSRYTLTQQATM
jgi:hypothetical protein